MSEAYALEMDAKDPLGRFRERFLLPEGVYMLGNSLGPLSRDAEAAVTRVVGEWRRKGVGGWFEAEPPWLGLAERVGAMASGIMGAEPEEVVATGSTTVNIHALASAFYRPEGRRRKILADELNFPSDLYALAGQIRQRGGDPAEDLVLVPSSDGRTIDEQRVVSMMTDEIALVHLPSVLYRSAQLLDVGCLARAAAERGIHFGLDCSHSAGVVEHRLDEWGVDYAVWCGYKYLCSGPGGSAFLYLARRHFDLEPLMPGWFGFVRERQFDMLPGFEHERSAGGFQISSPGILGIAPLEASLGMILEAGIRSIRDKSVGLTSFLVDLVDGRLSHLGFRVGSPRDPSRRGGHVAVETARACEVHDALAERGVIVDFRPPDVIRIAPSPLFNTWHEVWRIVEHLLEIGQQSLSPPSG